jgi:hypothetical protein
MTLITVLREVLRKELKPKKAEVRKKLITCKIFKVEDGRIVELKNKLTPTIKPACKNLMLLVDEMTEAITLHLLVKSVGPRSISQQSFSEMLVDLKWYMSLAAYYKLITARKARNTYKTICDLKEELNTKMSAKGSKELSSILDKPNHKRKLVSNLFSIFKKHTHRLTDNAIYYDIAYILRHFKVEEGTLKQIHERIRKYRTRQQAKRPA